MGPTLPFSEAIHAEKYRGKGESFKEAMNRVAGALEDNDEHFRAFRDALLDMRFIPGGRIQASIGSTKHTTAYNCFVSGVIEDSFVEGHGSIMAIAAEAAATMRMGGGIGYDFSTLRPRGDYIRKLASKSSGPVSFMEIYDAICRCVSSSGHRRGAQMAVMSVDHPDIEEFIHSKQPPQEARIILEKLTACQQGSPEWLTWYSVLQMVYRLTGFNISIAVTDEFMKAVQAGALFALRFGGRTYREVDAKALWDTIMRSAWDWAEPGVLFIDTIRRMNNLWYCENIIATNPCFTGDTLVWTDRGSRRFDELAADGRDVQVLTQNGEGRLVYRTMRNPRCTQRGARLVRVMLDNGQVVKCTPQHKFFLKNGQEVEAQDLHAGDSLQSVYRYCANQKGYLKLTNGIVSIMEHHVPFEGVNGLGEELHIHHRNGIKNDNRPENLELLRSSEHNSMHMRGDQNPLRRFPDRNPMKTDPDCLRGERNGRWRSDISIEWMLEMREAGYSFAKIAEACGCCKYTAQKRIKEANHRVVSVETLEIMEDVYCGTVDETHSFFIQLGQNDGMLVRNCGEQPLPPYGACLLGSFNLVQYVKDRITRNTMEKIRVFDWEQLKADIPPVVRAMDNVIDKTTYPLYEQEKEAKSKRRMGLGVMGLANALEALDMPYGSQEFIEFEEKLLRTIANECYKASVLLGQEKGTFPLYDPEKYLAGEFIKTLEPETQELIQRYGIRNSHLTSIAPTGTISICADNVSSGIEPVFSYTQKRVLNMLVGRTETDFGDYGYRVFGTRGKRSSEVTVEEHLAVLAVAAHHVDSSVSKTCNVPVDMPWQQFKDLYIRAWELGCKGLTTYQVGGRRAGVIRSMDDDVSPSACTVDVKTGRRECE